MGRFSEKTPKIAGKWEKRDPKKGPTKKWTPMKKDPTTSGKFFGILRVDVVPAPKKSALRGLMWRGGWCEKAKTFLKKGDQEFLEI